MLDLEKFLNSDEENHQKQDYIRAYKKNNKPQNSNKKHAKREQPQPIQNDNIL